LTKDGGIQSFAQFVVKYPTSPFKKEAEEKIYQLSTKEGTEDSYHAFITTFASNEHIEEAWRKIYEMYSWDLIPVKLMEFKLEYSDYPYMEDLNADLKLMNSTLLPAKNQGKWGFINLKGKVAVTFEHDQVTEFSDGLAAVRKGLGWGYINKRGQMVIDPNYDEAEAFQNGKAIVLRNDLYGVIDHEGSEVTPIKYDEIFEFSEGLAAVGLNDDYGYINEKGKEVIPLKLDAADDFSSGLAAMEIAGSMPNDFRIIEHAFNEVNSTVFLKPTVIH
jgi:hypothetical protein